jgi:hypothetical protein
LFFVQELKEINIIILKILSLYKETIVWRRLYLKKVISEICENTIAEKIEKLKNFIEFTLEASRDIKKLQSMTA